MSAYSAGKRFVEQGETFIRKQIQNPTFFEGLCKEWIQGYIDGVKERYPHLVEMLFENPVIASQFSKEE